MSAPFIGTSKITHNGRVVYNAQRDWLHTKRCKSCRGAVRVYDGDDFGEVECHSIQPYELTFRHHTERYKKYKPNDTDLSVFSSENAYCISPAGQGTGRWSESERIKKMMEEITFAGVASNRAIYDPSNHANEEGLAVQVGGLQTIYNTGTSDIHAGDIVLYGEPLSSIQRNGGETRRRIAGVPHSKMLFSTVRYDPTSTTTMGAQPTSWNEYRKKMFDIQRRVIGKAMSHGKPGAPFDILLGRYCV